MKKLSLLVVLIIGSFIARDCYALSQTPGIYVQQVNFPVTSTRLDGLTEQTASSGTFTNLAVNGYDTDTMFANVRSSGPQWSNAYSQVKSSFPAYSVCYSSLPTVSQWVGVVISLSPQWSSAYSVESSSSNAWTWQKLNKISSGTAPTAVQLYGLGYDYVGMDYTVYMATAATSNGWRQVGH